MRDKKTFHVPVVTHVLHSGDSYYIVMRQREIETRVQLTLEEMHALHSQLVHALIDE